MKRKRRNTDKTKINFMKPITDVLAFGSENDPCFGKHYSPQATECNKCGDNELCILAIAQNRKIKRAKLSETHKFKDLEDIEIDIEKALKNIIITNKITLFIKVSKLIQGKFGYAELEEAKEAIKKHLKNSKNFKLTKRDGKRHIIKT